MSVKTTDAQHLSGPTHVKCTLFAPLLCLSYIQEANKRKLSTVSKQMNLYCPLAIGGGITERVNNNNAQVINGREPACFWACLCYSSVALLYALFSFSITNAFLSPLNLQRTYRNWVLDDYLRRDLMASILFYFVYVAYQLHKTVLVNKTVVLPQKIEALETIMKLPNQENWGINIDRMKTHQLSCDSVLFKCFLRK